MKKTLLYIFLVLSAKSGFSQALNSEDSLIKYSYFLQGYADSTASISQGTGFFVNSNGKNLLVTAKHVLTGCKFNGTKDPNLPDEMILYFNENPGAPFNFFPLNVKTIKDTSQCQQYYLSPDIITYPVQDTAGKAIFTIDKFLPSYLPSHTGKIVIFGYPSFNNLDSGGYFVRPAMKLELAYYDLHESFTYSDPGGAVIVDTINYTIKPQDLLITSRLKGYSGSPAFIKDDVKQNWIFLGVIIAIDDKNNLLTIVKPESLLQQLSYNFTGPSIESSNVLPEIAPATVFTIATSLPCFVSQ
jgi:hypothetical protein